MKGIAPSLAALQAAGKGSKDAKALRTSRLQTAGKQGAPGGAAGPTRFETAVREKLALASSGADFRSAKAAQTKARPASARPEAAGKDPARTQDAAADLVSQDRAREREKAAGGKQDLPSALAQLAVARVQVAQKAAPGPGAQDRRIEAASGTGASGTAHGASGTAAAAGTGRQAAARETAAEAPRLTVTDLRRRQSQENRGQGGPESADLRQAGLAAARRELRAEASSTDGEGSPKAGTRAVTPGDFGARLQEAAAREAQPAPRQVPVESIRDILPPELVKTAGIVVRDGDAGEIRLVLKPESLGNVRIRMSLGDDGIDGRILVDSQAVKEIFEARLSDLAQALRQEGFQNATLSVSVGGGDAQGRRREESASGAPPRQAGADFERGIPIMESVSMGDYRVNLMA